MKPVTTILESFEKRQEQVYRKCVECAHASHQHHGFGRCCQVLNCPCVKFEAEG